MNKYRAISRLFPLLPDIGAEDYVAYLNTGIAIIATFVFALTYFLYFILTAFTPGILANTLMLFLTIVSFLILRHSNKRVVAANVVITGVYLSVVIKTYAYGGINSSSLFWVVMVPLFGVALFLQKRYIIFWYTLSIATVLVFFCLSFFYVHLNQADKFSYDSMVDIIGISLGIGFFSHYTGDILMGFIRKLNKAVDDSERHSMDLQHLAEQLEKDIEDRKKVEAELLDARSYFEALFEHTGTATFICTEDKGVIESCNSKFEVLSGLSRSEIEGKMRWMDFVHERSIKSNRGDTDKLIPKEMDFWFAPKKGEPVLCHSRIGHLEKKGLVIISIIDIGHRKRIEEELKKVNSELRIIFENSQVGIMVLKNGRFFSRGNQRLADIFGYEDTDEMQNMSMKELHLSEYNFYDFGKRFYDTLVAGEQIQVEYQLKKKNGTPIWCSLSGKALDNDIPPDLGKGVLWIVDDITSRKKLEFRLRNLASRDYLTGLYNRRQFINLAQKEFDRCKRKGYTMSFLMIDIDYFKQINDKYGHATGDEALKLLASIGTSCMRNMDVFGRIGGEEFAAFLPDTDMEQALVAAERLRESVSRASFISPAGEISFTITVGVAVFKQFMTGIDDMMGEADSALYRGKGSGRNKISF